MLSVFCSLLLLQHVDKTTLSYSAISGAFESVADPAFMLYTQAFLFCLFSLSHVLSCPLFSPPSPLLTLIPQGIIIVVLWIGLGVRPSAARWSAPTYRLGIVTNDADGLNATAVRDLSDRENENLVRYMSIMYYVLAD